MDHAKAAVGSESVCTALTKYKSEPAHCLQVLKSLIAASVKVPDPLLADLEKAAGTTMSALEDGEPSKKKLETQ